jgi:ribosomal protein S18 acetylase RimI-like enzyme
VTLQESDPIEDDRLQVVVRDFDVRRDREAVIRCVAALQDFERTLEPTLPPGERIARRYVEAMLQRCSAYEGRVFVASLGDAVVAFVCVLARIPETALDESNRPHAAIGELFVDPDQRGAGVGSRLLERAERHARLRGADRLRVQVLADNGGARELYRRFGFRDRLVELEKRLEDAPSRTRS